MKSTEDFFKSPSAEEFLKRLNDQFLNTQRPPDQILLDEASFCDYLNISKRHAANLRAKREITYFKAGGKLYYKLSDVLAFVEKNKVPAICESSRLSNSKIYCNEKKKM